MSIPLMFRLFQVPDVQNCSRLPIMVIYGHVLRAEGFEEPDSPIRLRLANLDAVKKSLSCRPSAFV
jgi:hypothetical protein